MNTVKILLFVAVSIQSLNTYFASVPEIPRYVIVALGAASVVSILARESLKPDDVKALEKGEKKI